MERELHHQITPPAPTVSQVSVHLLPRRWCLHMCICELLTMQLKQWIRLRERKSVHGFYGCNVTDTCAPEKKSMWRAIRVHLYSLSSTCMNSPIHLLVFEAPKQLTSCHKITKRHLKSSPLQCLFPFAAAKCISRVIFHIQIWKLPRIGGDL